MVKQQRKSWQFVPPIIAGEEIPLADVELTAQHQEWQIVPPVVTGAHLPVVKEARSAPLPSVPRVVDTDKQMYHLSSSSSLEKECREPFRAHFPAQSSSMNSNSSFFSLPADLPAWPEQEQVERHVKRTRDRSGASALQRSLASFQRSLTSFDNHGDYDERRRFFNQVVQPALEGLMDGSLSSLGPIFLTIFMTRQTLTTFLIGAGAALAGGISETFSESLSDDEDLSERGNPFVHAGITGLFTFISGLIPALPFLIANYRISLDLAYVVVILELAIIAGIRSRFLGVKWWLSAIQIIGGGALVFIAAVLLGNI